MAKFLFDSFSPIFGRSSVEYEPKGLTLEKIERDEISRKYWELAGKYEQVIEERDEWKDKAEGYREKALAFCCGATQHTWPWYTGRHPCKGCDRAGDFCDYVIREVDDE